MGLFQDAFEQCKELYENHKESMYDCVRNCNVKGTQFHSGVMLGIAETVNKIFGDSTLYDDWMSMFTLVEESS